jgi:hypothetical protein
MHRPRPFLLCKTKGFADGRGNSRRADDLARVSGAMVATISTTWKRPRLRLRIPFWPVIMTIGIAPSNAKAAPVVSKLPA